MTMVAHGQPEIQLKSKAGAAAVHDAHNTAQRPPRSGQARPEEAGLSRPAMPSGQVIWNGRFCIYKIGRGSAGSAKNQRGISSDVFRSSK